MYVHVVIIVVVVFFALVNGQNSGVCVNLSNNTHRWMWKINFKKRREKRIQPTQKR